MSENKDNTKDNNKKSSWQEEFKVAGGEVIDKIKELIHEGNVRRIILKNDEGKVLMEIPLTLGVVGAALAPVLAGVGAIAALVAKLTILVEKEDEPGKDEEKEEEKGEEVIKDE